MKFRGLSGEAGIASEHEVCGRLLTANLLGSIRPARAAEMVDEGIVGDASELSLLRDDFSLFPRFSFQGRK